MYSNFFDRFAKTIYNIKNNYVSNICKVIHYRFFDYAQNAFERSEESMLFNILMIEIDPSTSLRVT